MRAFYKIQNARAEYSKSNCILIRYLLIYIMVSRMWYWITWYYDNNVRLIYCCDLSWTTTLVLPNTAGKRSYMAPTLVLYYFTFRIGKLILERLYDNMIRLLTYYNRHWLMIIIIKRPVKHSLNKRTYKNMHC